MKVESSSHAIGPPNGVLTTLLTLGLFIGTCAVLAVAPVPMWAKPFQLQNVEDARKFAARVFARPRMTLQHAEEQLAAGGASDGRDAPDGQGIVAQPADSEERELLTTRDARVDVDALKEITPDIEDASIRVDRAAVIDNVRSPTAEQFRGQAASVDAPGGNIDNAQLLQPFFSTLDAIAAGDDNVRAGVVILGNSLIASDHVTDVVRARLVERFGDAGRGFLLPERLSKIAGRRVRTGQGSAGWAIETFAQDAPPASAPRLGPFGFTGTLHASTTSGDKTTWRLDGARRARLFYLEHAQQPSMRLEVNSTSGTRLVARIEALSTLSTKKRKAPRDEILEVDLPADAKELVLVAEGKGAKVFGVALEKDHGGVVVDTIGVPAASARLYVEAADADIFVRQVAQREPSLFVAMLGGNEVRSLKNGTIDPAGFDAALAELLRRAKKAAPNAACLIVTPIDAVKATAAGEELATRPEIATVIAVQRNVAKREGCAVFDLFAAMGGAGSLSRFRDKGFLSDDLVHPTWRGGDVLGQLFSDALLDAYAQTSPAATPAVVARRAGRRPKTPLYAGLSFPALENPGVVIKGDAPAPSQKRPLQNFFRRLRRLESGESGRVAIGLLGASHTAGQMWTDRMRQRLGERFGMVGRGFVSVGRESKRLAQGGVVRKLTGSFEIADGRNVVLGGALGMSGTKTRLEPGAAFRISYCAGKQGRGAGAATSAPSTCIDDGVPGFLQLAWLYTPDTGTADVIVNGATVARMSAATRRLDSDVQFLRVAIDGPSAMLEVRVREEPAPLARGEKRSLEDEVLLLAAGEKYGPVHLLSVVEERERSGIVLDAVGLPGTTGMTPQRWRQELIAAEVAAREYDLVVTAWGTNEAGIGSLDEATYRHHFERTLTTLMNASPGADCLIIGASDRLDFKHEAWQSAPAHELVERVQKQIASDRGCAFFSLRRAMGGPRAMEQWVKDGLGHPDHVHFSRKGYQKLGDLVINDLFSAFTYDAALLAAEQESIGGAKKATTTAALVDQRGG